MSPPHPHGLREAVYGLHPIYRLHQSKDFSRLLSNVHSGFPSKLTHCVNLYLNRTGLLSYAFKPKASLFSPGVDPRSAPFAGFRFLRLSILKIPARMKNILFNSRPDLKTRLFISSSIHRILIDDIIIFYLVLSVTL
jgi:hypothetical protein